MPRLVRFMVRGLVVLFLAQPAAFAAWDSTKPEQTQTVSAGMQSTLDNFTALAATGTGQATLGGTSDANFEFEGATANDFETTLTVTDPTADRTLTLPNETAAVMVSSLTTNATDAANAVTGASNALVFEGATANDFETSLSPTDPTADRTITVPDITGTMVVTTSSPTLGAVTVTTVGPATPAANTLYTDNIVKGWIKFADSGTAGITDDFNVTSIADNGTGDYTVTWDRDFANDSYAVVGTALDATSPDHYVVVIAQAAGTTQVNNTNSGGTQADCATCYLIAVGD